MKVQLIDHQENALDLLIYTKNTRLRSELTLADIKKWDMKKKLEHLDYMKKTIQSAFEFVRYTFNIEGVSRSFTHQLVRTRSAVYAQESQRTVDVRNSEIYNPSGDPALEAYGLQALEAYADAIDRGVEVQHAREILPTGINTSISIATHLRELSHMAEVRLCTRTAGEYQRVFRAMKAEVARVHPYFEDFIEVACVKTGICCFPNYTECPIQEFTVKIPPWKKLEIKSAWTKTNHVANPKIIKTGMTM